MKTVVCSVCKYATNPEIVRCGRCGWELRDAQFFGSLTDIEEESYFWRRELARARWKEYRRYDQSPRRGALPAVGTNIQRGPTSSGDLAIGGRLL
jgi:hypothetical protein